MPKFTSEELHEHIRRVRTKARAVVLRPNDAFEMVPPTFIKASGAAALQKNAFEIGGPLISNECLAFSPLFICMQSLWAVHVSPF